MSAMLFAAFPEKTEKKSLKTMNYINLHICVNEFSRR